MKHKQHKHTEHTKPHKCYNPWLSRKFLLTIAVVIVSVFALFYRFMTGMEWVSIVSITLTGWGVVDHMNNRIFPMGAQNVINVGQNIATTAVSAIGNVVDPEREMLRDQLRHGQL